MYPTRNAPLFTLSFLPSTSSASSPSYLSPATFIPSPILTLSSQSTSGGRFHRTPSQSDHALATEDATPLFRPCSPSSQYMYEIDPLDSASSPAALSRRRQYSGGCCSVGVDSSFRLQGGGVINIDRVFSPSVERMTFSSSPYEIQDAASSPGISNFGVSCPAAVRTETMSQRAENDICGISETERTSWDSPGSSMSGVNLMVVAAGAKDEEDSDEVVGSSVFDDVLEGNFIGEPTLTQLNAQDLLLLDDLDSLKDEEQLVEETVYMADHCATSMTVSANNLCRGAPVSGMVSLGGFDVVTHEPGAGTKSVVGTSASSLRTGFGDQGRLWNVVNFSEDKKVDRFATSSYPITADSRVKNEKRGDVNNFLETLESSELQALLDETIVTPLRSSQNCLGMLKRNGGDRNRHVSCSDAVALSDDADMRNLLMASNFVMLVTPTATTNHRTIADNGSLAAAAPVSTNGISSMPLTTISASNMRAATSSEQQINAQSKISLRSTSILESALLGSAQALHNEAKTILPVVTQSSTVTALQQAQIICGITRDEDTLDKQPSAPLGGAQFTPFLHEAQAFFPSGITNRSAPPRFTTVTPILNAPLVSFSDVGGTLSPAPPRGVRLASLIGPAQTGGVMPSVPHPVEGVPQVGRPALDGFGVRGVFVPSFCLLNQNSNINSNNNNTNSSSNNNNQSSVLKTSFVVTSGSGAVKGKVGECAEVDLQLGIMDASHRELFVTGLDIFECKEKDEGSGIVLDVAADVSSTLCRPNNEDHVYCGELEGGEIKGGEEGGGRGLDDDPDGGYGTSCLAMKEEELLEEGGGEDGMEEGVMEEINAVGTLGGLSGYISDNESCSEGGGEDEDCMSETDSCDSQGKARHPRRSSLLSELMTSPRQKTRSSNTRYFWQYNTQAKGPKGERLCKVVVADDPHVLNDFEDPVFDPEQSHTKYKHNGKARRGDGNDITPNPYKLYLTGNELKKLTRLINAIDATCELPATLRSKSLREKNKYSSRACRLKKKAQHEANKLKLHGLDHEHRELMNVLIGIKYELVQMFKGGSGGTGRGTEMIGTGLECMTKKLEGLMKKHLTMMIAGHTADYVNTVLQKVAAGDRTGGIVIDD